MKLKCDYCGQMIDEGLQTCPHCGAALSGVNRMAAAQPKTIEELQQWYVDHNLPPEEVTRFFIGKDIKQPKAFGIYKDSSGDFVVYKNKADGERAVRYRGSDEGYAVNELYQKLKSEIADQKQNNNGGNSRINSNSGNSSGGQNKKNEKMSVLDIILGIIFLPFVSPVFATIYIVIALIIFALFDNSPSKGYYRYNGNDYYYQGSSWYSYDKKKDSWSSASNSDELDSIITDDTDDEYQLTNHTGMRFEDTSWYETSSSSSSSSSDYDWDSDSYWDDSSWDSSSSWDSGDSWSSDSTDWDSDW